MWARKAGSSDYDNGQGIAIDHTGNIYVTGYFSGNALFGSTSVSSNGSRDVFVAKYNADGSIQWVKYAGGNETDVGYAVAVGPTGIILVTGFYRDFKVTFGSTDLENTGGDDIFLWKIWPEHEE